LAGRSVFNHRALMVSDANYSVESFTRYSVMRFRRTCTAVRAPQFSNVGPSA
jgi:hypothetical protein